MNAIAAVRSFNCCVALLSLIFVFVYAPRATAADYRCTSPSPRVCDQGEAYAEAWAYARESAAKSPTQYNRPRVDEAQGAYNGGSENALGTIGYWQTFYYGDSCSQRPSAVTPFFPPSGSTRCISGCEVAYRDNGDNTTTYATTGKTCKDKPDCSAQGRNMVWNAYLGVCQPVEPECPEGKVHVGNACQDEKPCPDGMALVNGSCKKKDEECPAGMTRSPLGNCIPGDGQCAAGEARGKDGTCKKDNDGDGQPDEEEEGEDPTDPGEPGEKPQDEFSGGDTCTSPPSCSGSAIMCGQARIQWRIECNTRRNNNVSGGHCSQAGTPTCTGEKCNAMEYAGLLMQWRSACALEKLAAGSSQTPGASNTDKNANGVADALEGVSEPSPIGDGAADIQNAKKWGIGVSTGMLDTGNMFGGGSCPTPPTFKLMGQTISGADFPYFCQAAAILRALIQVFAAFTALQILLGRFF